LLINFAVAAEKNPKEIRIGGLGPLSPPGIVWAGREPTFVALEGYDSVLAVARAIEAAAGTDPSQVCGALRRLEIGGTRGPIAFATQSEGVVHQQWRWPPVCVAAYREPRQRFSTAVLLWDAERGRTGATPR